ncbi:gliding motility-associated lipoprotein GldK [Dysgonomonas hofstadii]|uniref:Gliding motility-associated lipoprotein GldK n=1 Tax=Dysgonomonas hofstadii TaxID=637886 RepID=A0A840CJT9_9BACT|nr:SUMF1/EgtB/PvdO family nonheme iron enzyme [Dysgonomonas hofstadii]MBB4036220.1 gliding motility-associated lipoprotein GldK [Dysgonomonas hofstadii]
MNKKTLLTSLLLLCVSIASFAQVDRRTEQYSIPSRNEYLLKDPLWFISVGGGLQLYVGEDDNGVPGNRTSFSDRLTFAPTLSIGRRVSNIFSIRMQLSGGSLHGFNDGWSGLYSRWWKQGTGSNEVGLMTKDPAWDYMGWQEGVDYAYSDVDAGGTKIWHPTKWGPNENYYMQHMRYISITGDVMLSLINLVSGYQPNRKFEVNPFVGLGMYQRFAHRGTLTGTFFGGSAGLNLGFNFTRNWQLYGEGRVAFVGDEFDGQRGDMNSNGIAQATLGVTYKFGDPKYIDPAIETRLLLPYNIARACDNMVLVPGGNIEMGTGIDPLWGDSVPRKLVAVSPFWMDETEVTNKQYREFVYWVRDSIVRERLADPAYGGDPTFKMPVRPESPDAPVTQRLNWHKSIPWKNPTDRQAAAINSVVGGNPYGADKGGYAKSSLNYKYEWFDTKSYYAFLGKMREGEAKSIVITKDTAYVNMRGDIVRETLSRTSHGDKVDFTNTYIINVYPDVLSWMTDFANAKSEQYAEHYFTSKAYDNFPVVGVSWEAADAYCAWRTDRYINDGKCPNDGFEGYRLPTEAEWEFAARNGRTELEYPWFSNATHTTDGLAHANFRASQDLKDLVSPVATFLPNRFGLYDMAGNVAEWTTTTFTESVDRMADEANPDFSYRAVLADPAILKRKIIKGGSWKDATVKSGDRSVEFQDKGRSFIGFRCVRSWGVDQKGKLR